MTPPRTVAPMFVRLPGLSVYLNLSKVVAFDPVSRKLDLGGPGKPRSVSEADAVLLIAALDRLCEQPESHPCTACHGSGTRVTNAGWGSGKCAACGGKGVTT